MKTLRTKSDLIRVTKTIRSQSSSRRAGVFLVVCALSWTALSPASQANNGDPNQNYYRDVILGDNPIMYWRLGETAGPIAYDESANERNATYVGNPALGLPGAILADKDAAAKFSGNSQYLVWDPLLYPAGPLICSGSFTVEAWVKEKKFHGSDIFFTTHPGAAGFAFDFRFDTIMLDFVQKEIRFDVGDGNRWLSISRIPFDFQPDVWYYIAAQVTPTGATYYVDGSAIAYTSYNGTPLLFDSAHKVELGANPGLTRSTFVTDNTIDEVAIYDYALTANQIWAHYFAGKGFGIQ